MAAATGKQASCLFKKRQQPNRPRSQTGYANEVIAGWLAFNGGPCDWRLALGEGLGVDDSWDPASQEQSDRERGEKKNDRGRARPQRASERERERERKTGRLTS